MPKNRTFKRVDIDSIVHLISTWPNNSISWEEVCCQAESILGFRPSRQGLNQREEILNAFQAQKKHVHARRDTVIKLPSSLAVAGRRIADLHAEIAEIKSINSRLRDRFQIWQYNAHLHGLSQSALDKPLPNIDRQVSS